MKQFGTYIVHAHSGIMNTRRTLRRYSEGGSPTRCANFMLNVPKLLKPDSKQTSVTE